MGRWWDAVHELVTEMPAQRAAWRKFGFRLMLVAGLLAASVYATVRGHPEQDLPLWPAWVLAGLSGIGFGCLVATWRVSSPGRPDPRVDHRHAASAPTRPRAAEHHPPCDLPRRAERPPPAGEPTRPAQDAA